MTTLACLWSRPRLERHVDGALAPWIARRVEAHLHACSDCVGRVESFRRLRALVRGAAQDVADPDWKAFWPAVRAGIHAQKPQPVRDSWWLPLWRPFWGHPRVALGGALAGALALALSLWPSADDPTSMAWAGPVIVQDVSTPDPEQSVMVYSSPDKTLTVIWLFNSGPTPDES
jgi:anti-sigma factor RsiW